MHAFSLELNILFMCYHTSNDAEFKYFLYNLKKMLIHIIHPSGTSAVGILDALQSYYLLVSMSKYLCVSWYKTKHGLTVASRNTTDLGYK